MIEVNTESVEEFGFYRAAQGDPFPIPAHLWTETQFVNGREEIVSAAVEEIFRQAREARVKCQYGRPKPPIDILEEGFGVPNVGLAPRPVRVAFWALCSLVLRVAQQDTRYWGVEDATVDRYCSKCRRVLPVSDFQACEYVCQECMDNRQAWGKSGSRKRPGRRPRMAGAAA